jgi:hypothetical protein
MFTMQYDLLAMYFLLLMFVAAILRTYDPDCPEADIDDD